MRPDGGSSQAVARRRKGAALEVGRRREPAVGERVVVARRREAIAEDSNGDVSFSPLIFLITAAPSYRCTS